MKQELVVATRNKKKLEEIKEILKDIDLRISSLFDYKKIPCIVENGKTFKENAIKKAVEIAGFTKRLTLGEDSGLCVSALGQRPGVYSSRFAGEDKNDLKNNLKLLKLLEGLPLNKRKAQYYCAVALADKKGLIGVVEGKCSGLIGFEMKGDFGFGYDPVFIPHLSKFSKGFAKRKGAGSIIPKYKKTFAQLGPRVKHKISHRYRALKKLKRLLSLYLKNSLESGC